MKKLCLVLIVGLFLILVVVYGTKNPNILSYSANDIYLNSIECGCIDGFPSQLLILESEEQLSYALAAYKPFSALPEFSKIMDEYKIGEYIYVIQYYETSYESEKVTCNELKIDKEEITIRFVFEVDKRFGDNSEALNGYITYAVLPKELLKEFDFSNQYGVIYLGK